MLQFKYNNKFIDFAPGQIIEFERNNPMYVIEDFFGEYSNQITIKYSDNNAQQIGDLFFDLSIKKKTQFVGELWDSGNFCCEATLIINASRNNRAFAFNADVTGYLLTGFSSFLVAAKNVKLSSLAFGGDRVFNYTTSVGNDGSNGIIQHLQSTWNNTQDYICAPVRNDFDNGNENASLEWMNPIDNTGNILIVNRAFIFPRVKYLFIEVFKSFGYVLDTTAMNGTEWEDLFLFSAKPLFFSSVSYVQTSTGTGYIQLPSFSFFLSNTFTIGQLIDDEVTCNEFVINFCKKYGWALIPIGNSNIIKLVPLKNYGGTVKDFTKYTAKETNSEYDAVKKSWSFKHNFPNNDNVGSIEFEGWKIEPSVLTKAQLPSPLGNYDNSVIFVFAENKYYKIGLDDTTNERLWVVHGDNIYNAETKDSTIDIDSNVTPMPIVWAEMVTISSVKHYGFVPYCVVDITKPFGLRTLQYLGMQPLKDAAGNNSSVQYPMLSCVGSNAAGTMVKSWSNVFVHKHNSVDYGIVEYWYKSWNKKNSIVEEKEEQLLLPLHELMLLQWNDEINLFNVPYLIKSFTEPRPYKGVINAKLQRLSLSEADTTISPTFAVYLKVVYEDVSNEADYYVFGSLLYSNVKRAKPVIYAFKDAAMTTPSFPVNLMVRVKNLINNYNGITLVYSSGIPIYKFTLNNSSLNLATINLVDELDVNNVEYASGDSKRLRETVTPSDGHNQIYDLELLPSADYIIIP